MNKYYSMDGSRMTINPAAIAKSVALFIAVPSYKETKSEFTESRERLASFLTGFRISNMSHYHRGDSVPDLARNLCVANFLKSPCTHLLFLDDDIYFNRDDVLRMIALDVDVIGGDYPKKYLFWEKVREAVIYHSDFANMPKQDALNLLITSGVEMTAKKTPNGLTMTGAVQADRLPGGFLLIKRVVFEKIMAARPDLHFETGNDDDINPFLFAFFKHTVKDMRWLGEDYNFSDLCREVGITLWVDTVAQLTHIGSYAYTGDPSR